MPQRSGLRERRNADSSRLTQPTVTETWVSEEQLDLAEIKQFLERCRLFSLAFLQFAEHHIYLSKDTTVHNTCNLSMLLCFLLLLPPDNSAKKLKFLREKSKKSVLKYQKLCRN